MRRDVHDDGLATLTSAAQADWPAVESAVADLLKALGFDPDDESLKETPARVRRFYEEWLGSDAVNLDKTFPCSNIDSMVVMEGINVWSLCEHHLLPFSASVSIGYIADHGSVLGASKFARIAKRCANRPQLQERMTEQIAALTMRYTHSEDVAVYVEGRHLCMEMRGVKTPATMRTSCLRGRFQEPATRQEFFALVM